MDPGRRLQPEGKRKKKLKPLKKTRKKKNLTPTVAGAVTVEIAVIRSELVQNVLEGLLGDADLAVQDLGIARLMQPDGIEELTAIPCRFPLHGLDRVGQMTSGPLSTQPSASVTSFVSRTRHWWRQVIESHVTSMAEARAATGDLRGQVIASQVATADAVSCGVFDEFLSRIIAFVLPRSSVSTD
jgi:hypothetical protein